MKAILNPIDTAAAGFNMVDVSGSPEGVDVALFERETVLPLKPRVVFFPVDAADVALINQLERLGYEYAETQLFMSHRIRPAPEATKHPYRFEEVLDEKDLLRPLELAGSIFEHDRFTTDPRFDRSVSGKRYQAYLRKSFHAEDERVFVMKHTDSGEVVSFATVRELGGGEIRLLIGGVANELKESGMGVIHEYVGLQTYHERGYQKLTTAVSAINAPIINLEIRHLGFRVTGCRVVMRKWHEV
jgi:hypothetical protein